jgi:hypothetical protein
LNKPCCPGATIAFLAFCTAGFAQNIPAVGPSVNMVSGIRLADGDPFLTKQNESTMAVSSVNPLNIMGGSNDYRLVPLSQTGIPGESVNSVDAWVSRYWSTDGGRTWRSRVVPGCPLAIPQCAGNSALQGLTFASDPTVRSGPNGTFFYSFIAGNRGSGASGVVAVQRWFDLNNATTFSADPFLQDKLNVIDTGTTGQLLDKPWTAADISRSWNAGKTCLLPTSPTPVPAFNVYVAYSNFVGQDPNNPHPQTLVATSTDCGNTFGKPKKVSQSVATNQGTVLTIDPQSGTVYLFWRQFFTPANNTPDAVYFVKSTNGGSTWSSPSLIANNVPFYEQETQSTQFRAESFVTAAVSVSGGISRVHVAWAQAGVGPNGDGRIVLTTSSNGGASWTVPAPVDNNFQNQNVPYAGGPSPVSWSAFNPFNPGGFGHQYQPALLATGSKLTLIWQDQRLDHTVGTLACPAPSTAGHSLRDCTEYRTPMRTKTGATDSLSAVFSASIDDAGLNVRHTVDAFAAQAIVTSDTPVFASTRVSQYPFGSVVTQFSGTRPRLTIQQLRFNVPNVPIFAQGTLPFDGDYNDVAAQSISATGNPSQPYAWNTDPNAIVHLTWTTNQDVVSPKDGNWANFTPIQAITGNTAATNPLCLPGQEGLQNQNVYTATIFNGIEARAVVNSKYLNNQTPRQFNIVVQNGTAQNLPGAVSLSIGSLPAGTAASFTPAVSLSSTGTNLLSLSGLNLLPWSSLTRTVWVVSSNPAATITVNVTVVTQAGTQVIPVLLNPDPAATLANASQAPDIVNNNQSDVAVVTTDLSNADLTANNLTDNNLTDNNLTDNNLTDNNLTDNNLTDNNLTDNNLTDNNLTDNNLTDNNLTDNNLTDNNLTDNNLTDGALSDSVITLFNNGNTDVSFSVKTLMRGQMVPPGYNAQLILHKTYDTELPDLTKRASGGACGYSKSSQDVPVLAAKNPMIVSPTDPSLGQTNDTSADSYTISLLPEEIGRVVVRLVKNGQTLDQNQQAANEFAANGVKVVAVNGASTVIPVPVVVDTLSVPEATAGSAYSTTLIASGGLAPVMWTLPGQTTADCSVYPGAVLGLPAGLSLTDATLGIISGAPTSTTPGLYCFRVRISDSSSPHIQTDSQLLTMIVHGTQSATFPAAGPLVYGTPVALAPNSSAGLPITWSVASGACTISSGPMVMATSGTGSCVLNAAQAGNQIYLPLNADSSPYTLSPAPLTISANSTSKTYGSAVPALTASYTGFVNGDSASSLSIPPSLSTNATSASHVSGNPYTITVSKAASPNYTITYAPGTLTINPAPLVITANNQTKLYGAPLPALTAGYNGFVAGDTAASLNPQPTLATTATAASPLGGYPITVTGAVNPDYSITFAPGTLTVTQAALTITILPAAKVYGDPLPAFSPAYSGFVAGDGPTVLIGTLAISTTATASSPVGSYAVIPSGVTAANYVITFLPGTLTVNKATPVFSNLTIQQSAGVANLSGTIGYAGLFPTGNVAITLNAITQSAAIDGGSGAFLSAFATGSLPLGSYTVTWAYAGDANFTAANTSSTLKISGVRPTGSMGTARSFHTATLLNNGKVLVAGGQDASGKALANAEVYDPAAGTFAATSNAMPNKAVAATATLLGNGKVLLAGGGNSSTQIYDPATNTWSNSGGMAAQRSWHTATLLPNGKVLIAGGSGNNGATTNTAQLYDPATGSFSSTGSLITSRDNHTATLLPNGKVLIAGGRTATAQSSTDLSSAEIYDPATGVFSAAGSMTRARYAHSATLFGGKVLIAGGSSNNGASALPDAELFDPAAGLFSATGSMTGARQNFTATATANGVLIEGGLNGTTVLSSSEQYQNGTFAAGPAMTSCVPQSSSCAARAEHTATLLPSGAVLLVGGIGSGGVSIATAELFVQ